MTGQSLFPDDYPVVETPRRERPPCCEGLVTPPGVIERAWTFTHALGHSRTPFTPGALALATQTTGPDALIAAKAAERAGWIERVLPERYERNPPLRWVGCLPRRR